MEPFQKILVPTDFSTDADAALDRALDLARRYGAAVTIVHAYQLPVPYPAGYTFTTEILGDLERSAGAELKRTEERAIARAQAAGGPPLSMHRKLLVGPAAAAITDEAEAGGHDLIVIGNQGHGLIERFLIGSVAERVVRSARCPVLTVRAGEGERAAT